MCGFTLGACGSKPCAKFLGAYVFRASSSESENALLFQFCLIFFLFFFLFFADFVTCLNFYNSIAYISLTIADTNMVFPSKVRQDSKLHYGRKNFPRFFGNMVLSAKNPWNFSIFMVLSYIWPIKSNLKIVIGRNSARIQFQA